MYNDGIPQTGRPAAGRRSSPRSASRGPAPGVHPPAGRPDRSVVDDLVQKTFLKAWANPGFDPARADARAYLFATAANLVTDWLRSEDSRSVSLDELSERGSLVPSPAKPDAHDPIVRLLAEEARETVYAALGRLSVEHREVLWRFYIIQEGTQFQVASAMGLSVPAFNSRLNRARIEVKRLLLAARRDGDDATR
ncbi:MAG: sigma-70 family RNA polymerase sigma factor [Isosphaeraceae bacterium]